MACWHVGPHGPGCDGWVDAPVVQVTVNGWEEIAKQLNAQLQISLEQTRVAQQTAREAQDACAEALKTLKEHLKICTSR